ncbi:MAG: HlyD family efflux transporter periplasmic adaptor subunit, partial [FCB group bacterium]|nr:HlyD family efflux transporter periplasmic adaptor subunit [FCB group bacterium]
MKKRNLSIGIAMVILIVSVMISNFMGSQKPVMKKHEGPEISERQVHVLKSNNQNLTIAIPITGKVTAVDHYEIFAEVGGTLLQTSADFREGVHFKKGDILLQIDDREFNLNLLAQKSTFLNAVTQLLPDLNLDFPESLNNWEAYLQEFQLDEPLRELPKPVNDKEDYFLAMRNIYNLYYSIKSSEVRLEKYSIRAPYDGVLTGALVTPGTLVRTGQKLGSYMSTESFEVEAAVSMADIGLISPGNPVTMFSGDISGDWVGKVLRISEQIDPSTQTVKIFIGLSGEDLLDGMYLTGNVTSDTLHNVFELPRDLLVGNDRVFAIVQNKLTLTPVTVIKSFNDTVIVSDLADNTLL